MKARPMPEPVAKVCGQRRIDFDCPHVPGPLEEQGGQRAASRSDLDDPVGGGELSEVDDFTAEGLIN